MADQKQNTEWVFKTGTKTDSASLPPLGEGNTSTYPKSGGDKTKVAMPGPVATDKDAEPKFSSGVDPVVGWLVVIDGPGRGRAVQLGPGANSIGRDPSERAAFAFGDDQISSKAHANIMYDEDERAFFIAHVSGTNLTRLNGTLVGNLTPIKSGDIVQLGKKTKARFMAFCDATFDWSDEQSSDGSK